MTSTRFAVPRMDCPTEADMIRSRLKGVGAVERLDFDLLGREVVVHHADGAADAIEKALADIGMQPRRIAPGVTSSAAGDPTCASCEPGQPAPPAAVAGHRWWGERGLLALSGVAAAAAEITAWVTGNESSAVVIALSVLSVAAGGRETVRKGLVAVRTFTLNINFLMTLAIVGAVAIGQWPEAAMVTFLFAVAEAIESRSLDRANGAITSLLAMVPATARVRRDGGWVEVAVAALVVGDRVRVLPGESVPVDGTVREGQTSIDQAPITGESLPVDKAVGDPVFAGTLNQQGAIEVDVTAAAGSSTLDRIGRAIRQAQSERAPTQRFVDQFSRWYTPAVVVMAILVAVVPPLLFGAVFMEWLYRALVLLVIACPCALVIATPVTVVSGLTAAAHRGILVKGGVHLEGARRITLVAVDKTGTLTEGRPRLTDVVPFGGLGRDEVLALAAAVESASSHPVAHAITEAWKGALPAVTAVTNLPGKGIEATVGDRRLTIGSHRLAEERGVCNPQVERELERLEADGKTCMVLADSATVLAVLAVADTLRPTSIQAIQRLHAGGVRLAMLTGDNARTAAAIARAVGIDEVRAELLPEQKLLAIEELGRSGAVAMVGDGVNDAPALARANLGIAMGAAGSDTAIETADVALMNDDLRAVADLIELSRATARVLTANIVVALVIKAVFFALALFGVATLWMAVFADMGASLLVVFNGLRLLRWRTRTTDASPAVAAPVGELLG
jgi:Cd2+/Zn2+-exporting ATPase